MSVFVASPSDVVDERALLEEVIRELNVAWGAALSVRLELVRWETHAYPGFGADAQAVIDSQLPHDYDIFIGIMWTRFGTPTGRAGSGTEEEFARALERFQQDSSSIRIMFYFKDAPVAPTQLDVNQLAAVGAFRQRLGEQGGLYWLFVDQEQFGSYLRVHLAKQVQALTRAPTQGASEGQLVVASPKQVRTQVATDETDETDDLGFLDYLELVQECFGSLTAVSNRMSDILHDLAVDINSRTAELETAKGVHRQLDVKVAKRITNRAAGDMEHFAARMQVELPAFSELLQAGMNAFGKGIALVAESGQAASNDLNGLLDTVTQVQGSIRDSIDATMSLRATVAGTPRATATFNRAKRNTTEVLDQFIGEMEKAQGLLSEAEKLVRGLTDEEVL